LPFLLAMSASTAWPVVAETAEFNKSERWAAAKFQTSNQISFSVLDKTALCAQVGCMSPTDRLPARELCRSTDLWHSACCRMFVKATAFAFLFCSIVIGRSAETAAARSSPGPGNCLTYLDGADPFYVGTQFPKLTTPQWVGERGVDAVVILAVDDMTDSGKYETFLRPILDRLKQIDGRAPVSIMTRFVAGEDPQVQRWLKEGLSLEVHTLQHPCPLLARGDFQAAATNYYGCIDLLNEISGNKPVAFRMPCCDSMDSTSPRFFAELFNRPSPKGNFLSIDSSVMNLLTTNDSNLPPELVMDAGGRERFRKYFPTATNAMTKVSLEAFATTIENYPFPYVIGRLCWEFPCAVPSDWEAFNYHGATNQVTVSDWKSELDAIVRKQGVMTMVFHPHNWIRSEQLVELIDYAAGKYGKRVKFLNFREALERLNQNLLLGQSLRAADGTDNGVRLLDLNGDGYLDAIIANETARTTRVWNPSAGRWVQTEFPSSLVSDSKDQKSKRDRGFRFGLVRPGGQVTAFFRNEDSKGAWYFDGEQWREDGKFFAGLNLRGEPVLTSERGRDRGVRLRDVDNDGRCELLVGNESQNAVFKWSDVEAAWKKLPFGLPEGTSIVTASGDDNGLRFVDINGDGYDDAVFSNETGYSAHLFIAHAKQWLGWDVGWSYKMRGGKRGQPGEIPMIVRGGEHPNNGAWFHSGALWVQNEDTSELPDKVARVSFTALQVGDESPPKSTSEALSAFRLAPGLKIELVASEPLIVDPVAFDWAADGRLWVVEMRDYPLGMDGKGKAGGEVRVLEDTDGDGRYDKSTLFLGEIGFPNGILPWGKGALISAAPDIFYAEDTDGDGRADVRRLLFSGFREGNQQHRVNGFEYGLDNWVYAANGGSGGIIRSVENKQELDLRGHDLRIRPDEGIMELQPGATQFGRHRNDWGDWFGNDNSRWLWHYYLPEHYLARNPHLAVASLTRMLANYPESSRIFTASHPQQRFNWPNQLFEVTSACSATPYRDDLFGPEFDTSVFICEPANNVIHREVLEPNGVTFVSHRAAGETNSEFLASTDNWCRPVMVKTGPDGALYFADMYRLVIEHPEYFPDELKHRPDLRAGEDKGRIYRIYPTDTKLRPIPRLDRLGTRDLVVALDSANGWQRDTVQRLLVQSHNTEAVPDLEALCQHSKNPKTRLQTLCTLSGLRSLTTQVLTRVLKDEHWAVRRQAVVLSEPRFGESPELDSRLLAVENDADVRVRYQLAFSLGEWRGPKAGQVLVELMLRDWTNEAMQTAVLSSAPVHLEKILQEVFHRSRSDPLSASLIERLAGLATDMAQEAALSDVLGRIATPVSREYAAWQVAGVAGMLDALGRRNLTLAAFQAGAGSALQKVLSRLDPIFEQARHLASDSGAEEVERLVAIRLLDRDGKAQEQDTARLGELLGPQNSTGIQKAALAALRQINEPQVAQVLLKSWRACGLNQRQELLNTLFSRTDWTEVVVAALEQGRLLPGELGPLQQQKLLSHSVPDIRQRAAHLFSAINSDRKKILDAYKDVGQLEGNRAKGHDLFTKNCSICHHLRAEGQSIGPDLGTVADKPVQELVVAILDPNQAVDPAYTAYTAITRDEREMSGILVAETPNSISLKMAGGAEEQILRSNLKELTSSGRSLMPEGFEAGLKQQDLADLIAYVLNPK
jgi:putative membrane-bound dehydrogenase-like protein